MQNKTNHSQKQVDSQRNSESVLLSEETLQKLEKILGKKLSRSFKRKFDRSRKDVRKFNDKPLWAVQEFFQCPDDYYSRLTSCQKRILSVLVHGCLNYRMCYMSYEYIAARSGCCVRTVASAVDLFRADGIVGTMYRHKTTNLFRLSTDWRRQSVIDTLKKYFPVLKFVLSSFLLLSRVAPTACKQRNCIQSTKYVNKELIFNKDPHTRGSNYSSKFSSISNLLQNFINAQNSTPEVRSAPKTRTLNGQQPKIIKEGSEVLTPQEKRKLSLPPAYKEKQQQQQYKPPSLLPYTDKPRELPHEDIYISYFKLQDNYRENGNPLNLPNPYRAKFIERVEESSAESGMSKTDIKNGLYKLYLATKEKASDI